VGAGLIGYKPNVTGSVARSLESKLLETVSVKDFGAKGDGAADDAAAIQSAINYAASVGGGRVVLPQGTYLVGSTLNLTSNAVHLVGFSRFGTLIKGASPSMVVVNVSGSFCGIHELSFAHNSTPAAGGVCVKVTGTGFSMTKFIIRNAYVGIDFRATAGFMNDFQILDYESVGLLCMSMNDLFVSQFIMNAGTSTRGALGGIRLYNRAEAVVVTDGDILEGAYSMTMGADSYTANNRPAYNNFTNVFFDSSVNPTLITKCVNTEFVGCWFSGGRYGGGNSGADISTCTNVRFTNCRWFNCGSQGVAVQSTALKVTFLNCDASSNSTTAGNGVAHGFWFAAGCTGFQLIGCTAGNGIYTGVQGYGVFLGTGCSNFNIIGGNLTGNNSGAVGGDLTGAGANVRSVLGIKTSSKGSDAVPVGQTVANVTHGLGYTPALQDIRVTATSVPSSSGVTNWYVTGANATTFQIVTNVSVSGSPMSFGWEVEVLKA